MHFRSIALTLSAVALTAFAQFVPAPTDLKSTVGYAGIPVRYKQVPVGICELDPDVKSFTGYADISEHQSIFFWFFEARNVDPTTAPLTVWINGGPGSSSMIGLFQENGPCGVDIDGNVYDNPYSWTNASNMLFIDHPAQVGFSYSIPVPGYVDPASGNIVTLPGPVCPDYAVEYGTCGTYSFPNETLTADSTPHAAPSFWKTLQGFMGAFPQYSRNDFHFASESYGGHYGPIFNDYIVQQNKKNIPGAMQINLKSVLIGNGWYDPLLQYAAYYNFTVDPGNTYDLNPYTESQKAEMYNGLYGPGNCYDQIQYCYDSGIDEICSYADNFCYNQVEVIFDRASGRDEYDIRELTPDPFPYAFYIEYLNRPDIQAAIGAFQNYSESSSTVGTAFGTTGDDGRIFRIPENIRSLLRNNVTVMIFAGDADYICNWLGNLVVADNIGHYGFDKAGFATLQTSDSITHGEVKQAGIFSFVRIYDAGHEVPFYQPLAALEIFERAIKGLDIATGKTTVVDGRQGYISTGPPTSSYREGNSTIQTEVIPSNYTYNTTTHVPDPPKGKRQVSLPVDLGKRQRPSKAGKDFKRKRALAMGGKAMPMGAMKNLI